MDPPPQACTDAAPQQARDDQGEDQVQRQRAQTDPECVRVADERDERRDGADHCVRVDDRGRHVDGDEHDGEQREVAMQARGHEAWPAARAPAVHGRDAQGHHRGQEHERDDPARAHQVPDRLRGDEEVRGDDHHEPPDVATGVALDEVGATEVAEVEPELEDALLAVVESSVDVVVVAAAPVAPRSRRR